MRKNSRMLKKASSKAGESEAPGLSAKALAPAGSVLEYVRRLRDKPRDIQGPSS